MLTQKELSARQDNLVSSAMPQTKIRAFLEEFPWVRKHVDGAITQVYVSGVESSLLNYSPEYTVGNFFLGTRRVDERILLLDENGKEVIAYKETRRKKFFFFGPNVFTIGTVSGVVGPNSSVESVAEQLGAQAYDIRFLLSYYEHTSAVIIYRLPKGVSLKRWIENEVEAEKAKLQSDAPATA